MMFWDLDISEAFWQRDPDIFWALKKALYSFIETRGSLRVACRVFRRDPGFSKHPPIWGVCKLEAQAPATPRRLPGV